MTTKKDLKEKIEKVIEENFWDVYGKNTSMLSSICRQLAFAEGGICWFFLRSENSQQITLDVKIILTLLVLFFIFDASQYFVIAMYNKIIAMIYEQQVTDKVLVRKNQVIRPIWINYPGNVCFILKLCCLGMASFFLIGKFFFQYFQ